MIDPTVPDAVGTAVEATRQRSAVVKHIAGGAIGLNLVTGIAAAQDGANAICGTPLAEGLQQTAMLVVGGLVIALAFAAGIAEGFSRLQRDPQKKQETRSWRNGALLGVPGVPLLLWFVTEMAGNFGITVVECIDIVPFF